MLYVNIIWWWKVLFIPCTFCNCLTKEENPTGPAAVCFVLCSACGCFAWRQPANCHSVKNMQNSHLPFFIFVVSSYRHFYLFQLWEMQKECCDHMKNVPVSTTPNTSENLFIAIVLGLVVFVEYIPPEIKIRRSNNRSVKISFGVCWAFLLVLLLV